MSELVIGKVVRDIINHDFVILQEINGDNVILFDSILNKTREQSLVLIQAIPENSRMHRPATKTKQDLIKKNHDVTYDTFEDQYLNMFFFEKMKFCGCGDPESNLAIVKEALTIVGKEIDFDQKRAEFATLIGCKNERMQEFLLQMLDSYGLLEHGGSVWGSWLSDEGIELLGHLEYFNYKEE